MAFGLYFLVTSVDNTYLNMDWIQWFWLFGIGELGNVAISAPWRSGISRELRVTVGVVYRRLVYRDLEMLAGKVSSFIGFGLISSA